jgi:hypothetical protein
VRGGCVRWLRLPASSVAAPSCRVRRRDVSRACPPPVTPIEALTGVLTLRCLSYPATDRVEESACIMTPREANC